MCPVNTYRLSRAGIVIINDNSTESFDDIKNVTIIQSEFPGAGEILPYYYAWKRRELRRIIIIQDSCVMHHPINWGNDSFQPIWIADHTWDDDNDGPTLRLQLLEETSPRLLQRLQHPTMLHTWDVCFGVTTLAFLDKIEREYHLLSKVVQKVNSRSALMVCERIMGFLIGQYGTRKPLISDIHKYGFGQSDQEYNKKRNSIEILKKYGNNFIKKIFKIN